jgi:hypothetical protein
MDIWNWLLDCVGCVLNHIVVSVLGVLGAGISVFAIKFRKWVGCQFRWLRFKFYYWRFVGGKPEVEFVFWSFFNFHGYCDYDKEYKLGRRGLAYIEYSCDVYDPNDPVGFLLRAGVIYESGGKFGLFRGVVNGVKGGRNWEKLVLDLFMQWDNLTENKLYKFWDSRFRGLRDRACGGVNWGRGFDFCFWFKPFDLTVDQIKDRVGVIYPGLTRKDYLSAPFKFHMIGGLVAIGMVRSETGGRIKVDIVGSVLR